MERTPPSCCLHWKTWWGCVSICSISQRPFISKQNTMDAEKCAVPWYLFTTGPPLLLKPHSLPWAVWRAVYLCSPQCLSNVVLLQSWRTHTSSAKELGLSPVKSMDGQQGWIFFWSNSQYKRFPNQIVICWRVHFNFSLGSSPFIYLFHFCS